MRFNKNFKKAIALIIALITVITPLCINLSAEASVTPIDILSDYCIHTEYKTNDGTIGIPVGICAYAKESAADSSAQDTQLIFYVINYNDLGENLSDEDYVPIVYDLLDQGHIVITLDYFGNERACAPLLTESVKKIRVDAGVSTNDANIMAMLKDKDGNRYSYNANKKRVMMEGYRLASSVLF